MKILINSNLFPIISVGMYSSSLDPDIIFDAYCIEQDFEDHYINYDSEYFNDNFMMPEYELAIQNLAKEFFDDTLLEVENVKIDVKAGTIYSPKYYNFATDNIDLTVKFNKTKVKNYAKKYTKEFSVFLKENYTSYDGFMSFTANNYDQWLKDFNDNEDQSIGAVLSFIFKDEIKDTQQFFIEYCYENLFSGEFVNTESIDEEVEVIENYVNDKYSDLDIDNISKIYDFEYLEHNKIKKIALIQMQKIENQTLNLFKN